MPKIGISINEVLRDFIGQLVYTYGKYVDDTEIKEGDVTDFDLIKHFKFDNVNKLNSFMYLEAPLEIFGHADQVSDGLMNQFNNFVMDIIDDGEHQIELVSREVDKSIPSTYFFLSKTGCKIPNIRFVKQHADEWGDCDILITANPIALENKPNGKISVKIRASYNDGIDADFIIESLDVLMKDAELRERIFNTKITTYEEI